MGRRIGESANQRVPVEGSLGDLWFENGEPAASATLEVHVFETDKTETLHKEITDFSLSGDAKTLLVRSGNSLRALPAAIEPRRPT